MKKEFIALLQEIVSDKEKEPVKVDQVRPELLDGEQAYIVDWHYTFEEGTKRHTTELTISEIIYWII